MGDKNRGFFLSKITIFSPMTIDLHLILEEMSYKTRINPVRKFMGRKTPLMYTHETKFFSPDNFNNVLQLNEF